MDDKEFFEIVYGEQNREQLQAIYNRYHANAHYYPYVIKEDDYYDGE